MPKQGNPVSRFSATLVGWVHNEPDIRDEYAFLTVQVSDQATDDVAYHQICAIKVFGKKKVAELKKLKLAEGDGVMIEANARREIMKEKGGKETVKTESGKPVFQTMLVVDDSFGSFDIVEGLGEPPEMSQKEKKGDDKGGRSRGRNDNDRDDDRRGSRRRAA